MNWNKIQIGLVILFISVVSINAQDSNFWGNLKPGLFTPGFKLVETKDSSRFYPPPTTERQNARPIRIYIWYPALKSTQPPLRFASFVRMAAEDFVPESRKPDDKLRKEILPVPLAKGLQRDRLNAILDYRTASVQDAEPAEEVFPLLILGQGLYYESPLSHFVLCEFLASHGYVVATCPLLGTQYRLVNLNVEDLETQIRDLEFVIAQARLQPFVHPERLGVIGYDLGGMAGVVLSMRNPDIDAFLSMDSGILFEHFSGLPGNHPQYLEKRFTIPWMHMTQARFIKAFRDEQGISTLMGRKSYGDSYLVHVPTFNHGQFSSYAMLDIRDAVPGYWGPVESDTKPLYEAINRYALSFFNAYLKRDNQELESLHRIAQVKESSASLLRLEWKRGEKPPPSEADLIHLIIEKGMSAARDTLQQNKATYPGEVLIDESVLNWLGYHFLYWWGREEEAVEVFELTVSLFPESANAHDSLGEAYLNRGQTELAIQSYEKSLELNPDNANAASVLKRLKKK